MITKARSFAKKIVDQGYNIVPLFPYSKNNQDINWQNRKYSIDDVLDDSNIGINLAQSNLIDVDLDCDLAVHFGSIWLPHNTLKLARITKGKKEITHYFYVNNKSLKDNFSDKFKGDTILEFRANGQTVVYGQTPYKDDKSIMVDRLWVDEQKPVYVDNLEQIVKKIYVAVALCSYHVGANQGALKLDSCIMRYTEWSDSEREDFIYQIVQKTDPNSRDCTLKKMQNHVKSNNKEKKNSGYTSLANHLGVDPKEIKNLFKYIGSVPSSDDYEKTKSIIDFNSVSLDMPTLMTTELPPMQWAVSGILPEGFVCMAGRPKAMKSWTALKLCYAIQNGTEFLGHLTMQGDAIYFGLEDSKRRIQDRVKKLGFSKLNHPQMVLGGDVPYLTFGFEECLENWIKSKKNPRLVVIDTLARIKPRQSKSGTAYDQDNLLLNGIQKLAVQNNLTVLFITHLSKSAQDYSFDKIQGSVGVQGMTDAMWMLDRGDSINSKASLKGRGRDILDFEYALNWDNESMSYSFEGNLDTINQNENRREITRAMKELHEELKEIRPSDVAKYYGVTSNSKDGRRMARTMQRMADQFEIIKGTKYGTYILHPTKEGGFSL
jgi:RecA-family ATPase|tara:strand:+ start:2452 stop:4260 length:1809 start_codon:yes stop_codon:yes gene_type:complete